MQVWNNLRVFTCVVEGERRQVQKEGREKEDVSEEEVKGGERKRWKYREGGRVCRWVTNYSYSIPIVRS